MEFTLMSRKYINTGNEGTKTGVLRTRQQDPCNILKKGKICKNFEAILYVFRTEEILAQNIVYKTYRT